MKTYSLKPKDITRQWYVLDASEVPVGRVATMAARLLMGKDKPSQTKHIDNGDYVIIINSDKLITTGDKDNKKIYFRHSGFPGGIRKRSLREIKTADSQQIIRRAIRGMLPDNKLRRPRLLRLKIYYDNQHQHQAQSPQTLSLKGGK